MGFAIVHMQKVSAGAVKGLQIHNNREKESKSNTDIDVSKSDSNIHLIKCDNYTQKIKTEINKLDLKKAVRKDAVLMCNFVITSDNETMSAMSDEMQLNFFKESVEFFKNRYGDDNIVNAVVHKDETTPHLHLGVIPIKDGKLSAKNIFDKNELKQLQTKFTDEVGSKFGLKRGIENSKSKHLSEARFKLETAKKNLERYTKSAVGEMSIADMYNINAEKTLLGDVKGITVSQVESLKKTAIRALERNLDVQKEIDKQDYLKRQLDNMSKEYQHVNQRVRELNKLQAAVKQLPPALQEEIKKKMEQKEKEKNRGLQR